MGYINSNTLEQIIIEIDKLELADDEVVLLLVAEATKVDIKKIIKKLNAKNINFFGGIFPAIIYKEEKKQSGIIVTKFPCLAKPLLVENIGDSSQLKSSLASIKAKPKAATSKKTALILVDGLAKNIDSFITGIYNQFATSIEYIGGGAGSLTLKQKPCLFNNDGFYQNAGIIALLDLNCQLGLKHGWEKLSGSFVVTRVEGNKIIELNWQNAFEVYQQIVNQDLEENGVKKRITKDNFFEIAKAYPFGIIKDSAEKIVRDPIAVNEQGELICVGEIPKNAALDILKGVKKNLIKEAGNAIKEAVNSLENSPQEIKVSHKFVIDCISRVLFLEDEFEEEIKAINQFGQSISSNELFGILTLGEISSYGQGFIEFYNKTTVVGVFYE